MQTKTMIGLRTVGNWIQRFLEVRLPAGMARGPRNS
jgi:hypothetical protein